MNSHPEPPGTEPRRRIKFLAAVVLPLLLAVGACVGVETNTSGTTMPCPEGLEEATEYRLYFGLTDSEGETIVQEDWQRFVDGVMTPRFPDGLTILEAYGQWQPPVGDLIREFTRVLVVGVPDSWDGDAWSLLGEITDEWKQRYGGVVYHLVPGTCAGLR